MLSADDLNDGLEYTYETGPNSEESTTVTIDPEKESTQDHEKSQDSDQKRGIDEVTANESKPLSKRQKKIQNSKLKEKKEEQVKYQLEKKKLIPKSSPGEIVEYLASLLREKNPDLSGLELEELYFKKTDFLSTEMFPENRNLTNLPHFMSQYSKSPTAIILALTNLRIADIYRSLGGTKSCIKLFAKNKLKDDLSTVEKVVGANTDGKNAQRIKYFIATPTRLEKLIECTDLFFHGKEKLDILLDASYTDPKSNTLLNCENTVILCKLLKTFLNKKSSVKILLY